MRHIVNIIKCMLFLIWFTALLIKIRRTKEALMNLYNNNYTHNYITNNNGAGWRPVLGQLSPGPGVETVDCTSEAARTPQPAGGSQNTGPESQCYWVLELVNFTLMYLYITTFTLSSLLKVPFHTHRINQEDKNNLDSCLQNHNIRVSTDPQN